MTKSKKTFKTEVQQLLDLVIHSLYSNRSIFLRELVSNASDAIDRARFEAVSNKSVTEPEGGWKIKLKADKDARTLTITDNGIGMTRQELEDNIGTIANSGTRRFIQHVKESGSANIPELIGQFGVGFYASFMVADKVTLVTKRAGADEPAQRWESEGDGTYTVEDSERTQPGTDIVLHLKEDAAEYLDEWTLRGIIKQYSNYVAFPIAMDVIRTNKEKEGEDGEEKEITTTSEEVLNSMKALWTRPKSEITTEEYNEFYKGVLHDFQDPLRVIHYAAEGAMEFRALLFIPGHAPFDLFESLENRGLHLYVKRVHIMSDCKDLLPAWLRFVKGIVDSSDLPLNVSREMLQENSLVKKIRKNLVGKILGDLRDLQEKDNAAYLGFFREFGRLIKDGACDREWQEKTLDLLLFNTTTTEAGKPSTLRDIKNRMKPDQKALYYLVGDDAVTLAQSPLLEAFRSRNIEVILMSDPIDAYLAQFLHEYDGTPFTAINKGDIELGDETEKEERKKAREEHDAKYGDLLKKMSQALEADVKSVRLSDRLTESPCCLVGDTYDLDPALQRLMQAMGRETPDVKRILEINPTHALISKLHDIHSANPDDPRVAEYAGLLRDQALIAEGLPVKSPQHFAQSISQLMMQGLG